MSACVRASRWALAFSLRPADIGRPSRVGVVCLCVGQVSDNLELISAY